MTIYILTTHPRLGTKRSQFLGTREQAEAWIAEALKRSNQLSFEIVTEAE